MAFEDCNSFMSSEGQKRHIERVHTRWISFAVLAGFSAFLVALSGENGFWLIWAILLIAGAFYVDGSN